MVEPTSVKRKLTVILAADAEGYTRLMREAEEPTLETLTEYRVIIDGLIARHDGRVFNTAGDSVVAEFGSVWPDGMTTDVCGNVYMTDHFGPLLRIDPDGNVEVAADFSGTGTQYTPAVRFGSGVGGWDEQTLYVMSQGTNTVFAVEVGVLGMTLPHLE